MTSNSDDTTSALVASERLELATQLGESHFLEFKSALEGPATQKAPRQVREICRDVAKTLVAFANADGGELYVGVEDDGAISGVPHSQDDIQQISQAHTTHVHGETPLPTPKVNKIVTQDGMVVLAFEIQKGTRFVYLTAEGRCLKRKDLESAPSSTETIQFGRREEESRNFGRVLHATARLSDLDMDLVREVSDQVALGVTPEKCLQHLGLAEFSPGGLRIRNAALLLFAKKVQEFHPGCSVRIYTVRDSQIKSGEEFNVLKDEFVAANIMNLVSEAWKRLNHALTLHTSLSANAKFQQSYLYPQVACREALINAIVHRDYSIQGSGIEVFIYPDRLEVKSPGALLSTVSLDQIKALGGVHESRNPLIARVLRETGFVREMGEGIPRIFGVMRDNALASPELVADNQSFAVRLSSKSMYGDDVQLWLSQFPTSSLTDAQIAILALGYDEKAFSTQDIIDRLGIVDTGDVQKELTPLRTMGAVIRVHSRSHAYKIAKTERVPHRQVPVFKVRVPGSDPDEIKASGGPDEEHLERKSYEFYVGNISPETRGAELMETLSQEVEVLSISVGSVSTLGLLTKGYAFVTLTSDKLSMTELQDKLSEIEVRGRKLRFRPKW